MKALVMFPSLLQKRDTLSEKLRVNRWLPQREEDVSTVHLLAEVRNNKIKIAKEAFRDSAVHGATVELATVPVRWESGQIAHREKRPRRRGDVDWKGTESSRLE